jgi:hypothetical protein
VKKRTCTASANANSFAVPTQLFESATIQRKHQKYTADRSVQNVSGLHVHEQPLVARKFGAVREVVERGQREADPAQVLDHRIAGSGFGLAVDADDEAVAGEVVDFAEFEEGHEPIMSQ